MKVSFNPFPIMETKRLILRKLCLNDANDLFEIRSNPDMVEYSDGKVDEFIEDTIKYINFINKGIDQNKWINFGIINKDNNKLIGSINIWNLNRKENKAEIGYGLNPKYQGKGYMREALEKVVDYGLNGMQLSKIEVWTDKRNRRSVNLVENFGFRYIKEVKEQGFYQKQTFHMLVYEMKRG